MGCAGSLPTENQDPRVQQELSRLAKEYRSTKKLLLLGAGESGKSTICKQFMMINGFWNEQRREMFRDVIKSCILFGVRNLAASARNNGITMAPETITLIDKLEPADELVPEMEEDIKTIWKDAGVQQVWQRRTEFNIPECTIYLFENLHRIADLKYTPTDEDCLRVRQQTSGVNTIEMIIKGTCFHVTDVGGQRSERRKWIQCFSDVTAILYCIALDEYDMTLYENASVNRMLEAIKLFSDIVSCAIFVETPIVVFFNKSDLLKVKLPTHPIQPFLPKYTGGNNYQKAVEFIQNLFLSRVPETNKKVYPHITSALDRENIKFVWEAVCSITLQSNMDMI